MTNLSKLLAASVLAMTLPIAAQAAPVSLTEISFDYGTGKDAPFGDDPINADDVRVFDTTTAPPPNYTQFSELFAFGDLMGATIERIDITLTYSRVSAAAPADAQDLTGEIWYARVLGTDNSSVDDDFFLQLTGTGTTPNTVTFSLDLTSDTTAISDRPDVVPTVNSAFASSVAQNRVRLRFREESAGDDNFLLDEASVEVFGTMAPVPLPASGLLLVGALGGVAALKRRRKAAK